MATITQQRPASLPYRSSECKERTMAEQEVMAEDHRLEWTDSATIVFGARCCAAVWVRTWEPFGPVSLIGLVAALIGTYPILQEAFAAVVLSPMTMELSMA